MRHIALFVMTLMLMLTQSATCMADDRVIPAEQLPAAAKSFIAKHFPQKKIAYAEKDGTINATYEARLSDGTEIEFDKKGNWDKVDCKRKAVPAALIPAAIAKYVKDNYPKAAIVKIDKERSGYEIELSNKLELKFNKSGKFVGMDD